MFTAGLGRVPATAAGIVSLLEPLTATTLGLLVFGERLGPIGIAGAALLLTALALLTTAALGRGQVLHPISSRPPRRVRHANVGIQT